MEENLIKVRKKDYGKVIRIKDKELADLIKSINEEELKRLIIKYLTKKRIKETILKIFKGVKNDGKQ